MTSSVVQICNLALGDVGAKAQIQSIDEASREAQLCKLYYDPARREVLRDHDWGFASKSEALALVGGQPVPRPWRYAYGYPSDCLAFREILREAAAEPPEPFEIAVNRGLDGKVILADRALAVGRYSANVANATLFDAGFVGALAARLAVDLAQSLIGDLRKRDTLLQLYAQRRDAARRADLAENGSRAGAEPEALAARR
ncbi:hypothetical protein SAMN06265365_12330 [Tistlia consotensis]|uniref:Uncharacterized protein n=1 Tax=Tistlia consotensis USBA 355 TaxID=560819 RepID=A0A1Y6CGZ5_9PROT|nr:hypothetical protein [Tistlia consotensis]SMF64682.1 hypothetical protein SAMN05428998_12579 [Tistlia consotensis USBA 355]SNR96986.1 hypothetical protein SAMN06265365_12330 [Tistlia consotensis]